MKKQMSLKLSAPLAQRLQNTAAASRLKKNTIIEMCIETHLPVLERQYAEELLALQPEEKTRKRAAS